MAEREYHDGLPVMPPAKAAEVADRLRIQIIGVRAGWSAWAAKESEAAGSSGGQPAADERWRKLMHVDGILRAAESQLEMAVKRISEEAQR
jgi:hypothetical protein